MINKKLINYIVYNQFGGKDGETPKWSTESNKWISATQLESRSEETIASPKKSTPVVDLQDDDDTDSDLPF